MQIDFTVRVDGDEHDVRVATPAPLRLGEIWPRLLAVLHAPSGLQHDAGPGAVLGSPPLATGAVVRSASCRLGRRRPVDEDALALHVIGGRDAGRAVPLDPGPISVGRDPHSTTVLGDQRVSRHHVTIGSGTSGLVVRDEGSTNGTTVDGVPVALGVAHPLAVGAVVRIGDTLLSVRGGDDPALPIVTDGHLRRVAHVPRPSPPAPVVVDASDPPQRPRPHPTRWMAALVPAAAGGGLAWFTHSPAFLLFALLSPVMLIATALGDRVHWRRAKRADDAVARARRAVDDRAVAAALRAETVERRARFPDPVAVARAAVVPTTRLWQRHRDDPDALVLRIGTADLTSSTQLRCAGRVQPAGRLTAVPVVVDLRAGPLGIAGPPDVLDGVARCLVTQLAVLHPPGALDLALFLSDAAAGTRWSWARWLPHLGGRVASSGTHRARLAGRLRAGEGRCTVAVVDRAVAASQLGELADLVSHPTASGVTALVLGDLLTDLPPWCARTIDLSVGAAGSGDEVDVVDQVDPGRAEQVARALAPLSDEALGGAGTPEHCHLLDLLGFDGPTAAEIGERWAASDGRADTVVGLAADGPVRLDLERDGPHLLVAGTTGAGKSELLRTLVLGLALQHPPDEISLVLVDYKGGAAFADCAGLPHVVGSVTDLDPHLTRRALQSLEAELRRRERLFAELGASDLASYRGRTPEQPVARLVIVVDEFAALAETLPDLLRGLVSIAQRGRSLGVHLILATQRPGTAVTPEIRANTSCRIALRVVEATESLDVLGAPDAAGIPAGRPGRALLGGDGRPTEFQTACIGGVPRERVVSVRVEKLGPWRTPLPDDDTGAITSGGLSPDALVAVVGQAAAERNCTPVAGPWLAPLPEVIPSATLSATGRRSLALGLVDRPGEQRQDTLELDLDRATSWLVVGGPRSGRTTALLSAAVAAARTLSPAELEIYVIDGGGELATALRGLPHVASCLGPDELTVTGPLLRRLVEREPGPATVLVLVDHGERVLACDEDPATALSQDLTALLGTRRATVIVAGSRAVLTSRAACGLENRLVLRLTDRGDYALAGVAARDVPALLPPGRGVRVADGAVLHLAVCGTAAGPVAAAEAVGRAADRWAGDRTAPARSSVAVRIRPLPRNVELHALPPHPARLRLGLAGESAEPVYLDPAAAVQHRLVAGPARSGRTTTLLTLLLEARRVGVPVQVAAPTRSALHATATELGVDVLDAGVLDRPGRTCAPPSVPTLLLVDDVQSLAGTVVDDVLADWARSSGPLSFVVAGRSDELAATFRGVAAEVRRSRCGILLRPGPLDGELLDVRLPRSTVSLPGRGVVVGEPLVSGGGDPSTPLHIQVARP